jgi:diguanylate cyclase (GGDEF)-like protein
LFCDVGNFKNVNDAYGHRVGDTVLQTVARRLESILRENDTVARAGGDEFVVVLGDLGDPTEATRIAERARLALSEPMPIDGEELRITASLGVALNIEAGDTVETLLRRSDDAMYLAKERGRNQVAFAGDDILSPRPHGGPEDSAP